MPTDNMISHGGQHIYPIHFATISQAILDYTAAYDMACLLSGHLDYTKLMFRVDAAAHLQIGGKIWDRK